VVLSFDRDSVGDDDFLEDATAESGSGWGAENCMSGTGVHLSRPLSMQHL